MERQERKARRDTFMGEAGHYAAVRPGYPDEAMKAAVELAGLAPEARVLEVGCGAGQSTRWLAEAGFHVLAIDRSASMVEHAVDLLRRYRDVDVERLAFEQLPDGLRFDGLLFATSYHWLDPADRAQRCARHLDEGGGLMLLWHTHPQPFTGFFERVQPIYRAWFPEWEPPPSPGMSKERVDGIVDELAAERRFGPVERRSFDWSRRYGRADYLRLLQTYSDHMLLPPERLAGLLSGIATLIDREFDGFVDRPYRTELLVTRRS